MGRRGMDAERRQLRLWSWSTVPLLRALQQLFRKYVWWGLSTEYYPQLGNDVFLRGHHVWDFLAMLVSHIRVQLLVSGQLRYVEFLGFEESWLRIVPEILRAWWGRARRWLLPWPTRKRMATANQPRLLWWCIQLYSKIHCIVSAKGHLCHGGRVQP